MKMNKSFHSFFFFIVYVEKSIFFLQVLTPKEERDVEKWIVPSVISSRENELQAYQQNNTEGSPAKQKGQVANLPFALSP